MTVETLDDGFRIVRIDDCELEEVLEATLAEAGVELDSLKVQAEDGQFDSLRAEYVWPEIESLLHRITLRDQVSA